MKALSIRQPWAFAIVFGFKPVENRTWRTAFRGPVLIHAGAKEERDDVDFVLSEIAAQTGADPRTIADGYRQHRDLGCIVGAATVTDCVTRLDSRWFCGPYGFVLDRPMWGPAIPCRGALGFFDVPPDVVALLPQALRDYGR